uniref:Nuclear pore protein n=1 Tax=Phlebotomus kandelakii TaxID=1109342 RepID=A0A6B2EA94_9DIPT
MDFNTLVQQAQRLTNEVQKTEDIPQMERTLPQVLMAAQELHSRVTQSEVGSQDAQAHIMLGSKGIDLPKITQKLETLSSRKTFEPLDPIADTDIQSFLRNEKENAILSVIEEVHKETYKSAQRQKWDHIVTDWREEKVKLMNALIGSSQGWIEIQKGPEQTILNETSVTGRSCLSSQEMAYAREVLEYNRVIFEGVLRPNLVQKFSLVAEEFNDAKISEMWEIVKYMVSVMPVARSQDPLRQRSQSGQLIQQARKYLEHRYRVYMSTVVSEHLREAQLGGIPNTFNLVSAFVRLKFGDVDNLNYIGLQDGRIEGKPIWPMVFYCLRCGDIQAALKCLEFIGPGHEDVVQVLEEKFRKPEQKISSKLEQQIKMQYKRQIRNATDPFKRVVYCIVGACDIHEQHPDIAKTSDDFLWIQLSLIQTEAEANQEILTYSGLQTMILEQYGEKHFNASDQPHLYFQVLALTGQFEVAIEFLSRFERFRPHAIHIALALNELGMLGGARDVRQPLLSVDGDDPIPLRRLNLARLVMLYVKKFEITDPAEAIQYFFFLRNLLDAEGRNLFLLSVTDLAMECGEYDLIFGKIQVNGMRSRGLIDQFESVQVDAKAACQMVADELVKKGVFESAIKMYDLAENHEQVLNYTSVLLSQVVNQPGKRGSLRERIQLVARDIKERYVIDEIKCDPKTVSTFIILFDLLKFFDEFHEKKHQMALETLAKIGLVPFTMADLDNCLRNFKELRVEVCKVFPDILLATMDILYTQYRDIKSKSSQTSFNAAGENPLTRLREQAKALTSMGATIPYRMPGDVNNQLVQTEILMH